MHLWFRFGFVIRDSSIPNFDSDSWFVIRSTSTFDSDSWFVIRSTYNSDSWFVIRSTCNFDSDSWFGGTTKKKVLVWFGFVIRFLYRSFFDSDSWFAESYRITNHMIRRTMLISHYCKFGFMDSTLYTAERGQTLNPTMSFRNPLGTLSFLS